MYGQFVMLNTKYRGGAFIIIFLSKNTEAESRH